MIRSCQAGGSVPACGEGPGAKHRADFSSPLALAWLCQCHNFPWGCRPSRVGMAGLKMVSCMLALESFASWSATPPYNPGTAGLPTSQLSKRCQVLTTAPLLLCNPAPVSPHFCFAFFFSSPKQAIWKEIRSWGLSSQSLEVQISFTKWKGTTPKSGNNQSRGRKIPAPQNFCTLLGFFN